MSKIRFFRHSLLLRLSLLLLVLLLLVGVCYVSITAYASRNYFLETTQRLNASVADHLIKEVQPFKEGKVNADALGTIMHSMMAVNPAIEVYLLDPAGSILSFVVLDQKVKLKSVNIEPVTRFIASEGNVFIEGDDPRNPGKQVIFSAAPVVDSGNLRGYVYIVLQSEEYEQVTGTLFSSYFLRVGTLGFGLALCGAFALGLFLLALLTKSLLDIERGVKAFGEGDYQARIEVKGSGEMAALATSINTMADTIMQNIEDLKQVDGLRRELIANVSHDLRSPMTVIHGFVETYMMKKDSLNEAEQKRYLEAILVNSEKLRKLVSDLFELSKLEARQVKAHKEPLILNEMLAEICEQFALVAEQQRVSVQSRIPEKMPVLKADQNLLSRALHNLMDNAVKYTNPGGLIQLVTRTEAQHVVISLANSGDGISEEDLPHVFNRYYKAPQMNAKHSTGLGLAIARHIVELHGGEISVQSVRGVETAFTVRLPFS